MARKSDKKDQNIQDEIDNENIQAQNDEDKSEEGKESNDNNKDEKIAELEDKYLRLYSEFDNYKRRTAKERLELIGSAGSDLIKDLLPVIDDFERGLKAIEDDQNIEKNILSLTEGMQLVYTKMINILKSKGLETLNAQGLEFDSEFHEAITKIPAPTEDLKGKVVDVIEKGYQMNDKILRFAKVVIGE